MISGSDAGAPKRRRSLTHVGGEVTTHGDAELALALAEALDVAPAPAPGAIGKPPGGPRHDANAVDDPDREHVHGFHSYPARMHPTTAARLVRVAAAGRPGSVVLDPFAGSGTVLVEAMIAKHRASGTDLNPLAVRLARLKTRCLDDATLESLATRARAVAAFADERRQRRAGATRRHTREDVALFEPHVLLELDSLATGIRSDVSADDPAREALELVLSSILVKLSRRSSDTSAAVAARRIAAGYAARLFVRKTVELARRIGDLARLLPPGVAPASVALDDAARLRTIGASTIDAVVTSPPYVATYDYLAHHALRLRWLGLAAGPFEANEMGARRTYARLDSNAAETAWRHELDRAIRAIGRVCRGKARVVLVLADSAAGDRAIRAEESTAAVAVGAGFTVTARASQARPHFHGPTARAFRDRPRREHAILLEKR